MPSTASKKGQTGIKMTKKSFLGGTESHVGLQSAYNDLSDANEDVTFLIEYTVPVEDLTNLDDDECFDDLLG
jgi:hypothetical protein